MKQKKLLKGRGRYLFLLLFALCILFAPFKTSAVVVKLADGSNLTSTTPPLKNRTPVLFVHGHNFGTEENYKKNWQEVPTPHETPNGFDNLTSFMAALERNPCLNIEPYYIHFDASKEGRSIVTDADAISNAIDLILERHNLVDPNAADLKVAIIANSKGTISTRYYLKNLMTINNGSYPVSEFIAISPPNHGLECPTRLFLPSSLASRQLYNGYYKYSTVFNCKAFNLNPNVFPIQDEPDSLNFIKKLNEHEFPELGSGNNTVGDHPTEAPHSRSSTNPNDGILYVTLYAKDNADLVGGSEPLGVNCHGRLLLAKNLSPNAVNLEVKVPDKPEIPDLSSWVFELGLGESEEYKKKANVHRNTVHMPEVICKALYTVVHHQAPPHDLLFDKEGDIPIIPLPDNQPPDAGVVLLFDTSGSMSWAHDGTRGVNEDQQRLTLAKRAAEPFMHMLDYFNPCKANFGISIFPFKPMGGCKGQVITEMTKITNDSKNNAINTIWNLGAGGRTPLIDGIYKAIGMFGQESKKAIILLSDGYQNCPETVNINDSKVNDIITDLNGIDLYSIAFGQEIEVQPEILQKIAKGTPNGTFCDVTTSEGFNPDDLEAWDPANALKGTYKDILTKTLGLNAAADPMGVIKADDTITRKVKINKLDRKICFFLSWATPQKDRLGLKITAPDDPGNPISGEGISSHEGTTYKIITVDKSFLQQPGKDRAGTWKIEIDAGDLKNKKKENYQYSVIMDSDLKMKTTFDKSSYKTGDTITITVKITEPGRRVKGLKNVKVTVTRPGDGIGNWYAANKITNDNLASIPDKIGDENISRLHRKAIFLTEKRKITLPIRTGPKTFCLHDDGCIGDKKKGDGIYTFRYNDTIKEGTYSFYVQATSNKKSANPFDREEMIQKYITVNAVSGYSGVNVTLKDTSIGDNNILRYHYDVTFTPRDRFGNYMRPGYRAYVTVVYNEGSNDPILLKDNLDGTYSNQITLLQTDIDKGAKLAIAFDGKPIFTDKALPVAGQWSLSMHAGYTFPLGTLNDIYNRGLFLGFDLGYRLSPRFSLVGFLGYNRFKSAFPSIEIEDTYWLNISLNMKYEFTTKTIRPYINTGPGIYIPKTGTLRPGFNVGLGVDFSLSSGLIMELGTDYHHIFYSGSGTKFLTGHAGLIFRL